MSDVTLPIANGFYQSASLQLSNQECVNFYPNVVQTPALSQETLFGTAGLSGLPTGIPDEIVNTGFADQANRGGIVRDGIAYMVNGSTLYRIDREVDSAGVETFSHTNLGLIEGKKRVSMANNGTQIIILNTEGKGWILDNTDTLTEITDPDFTTNGLPLYVAFINGFFVATTDSKKFINSSLNDGLSWNALDFTSAEADPDSIVAPLVYKNVLYIAGSETIEAFQTIAAATAPFQRQEGFVIAKGVQAPHSLIQVNNTFMFIGGGVNESPAIWALAGNDVKKVSTTAIDTYLNRLSDEEISNIFAMSYAQDGAYFVAFKIEDKTAFVFNTITGKWHEQKSNLLDAKGKTITTAWRVNSIVTAYGRILCGDSQDGRIGSLEITTYKEYDRLIQRTFTTQPFTDSGNVMNVSKLEITCEAGVGDFVTENPQIGMQYSDDGHIFSDEILQSIGSVGNYKNRSAWHKLGRVSRFRLYKFNFSDPVLAAVLKLEGRMRGHKVG